MVNYNWRTELKTNKTLIKGSREKKLKIKRIRSEIEIPKIKKTNMYFLEKRDKRKKKKHV